MDDGKLKVLYIVGWGRSGTTILDNILGGLDGFVTTGELCYFWERGMMQGRLCGCGLPVWECEFWSAVMKRGFDEANAVDPKAVMRWQREALRVRHTWKILRSADGKPNGRSLGEFLSVTKRLYQSVAEETGARVVVDSSKRPPEAAALRLMPGITPFYIHMVRDPRAVAYSWKRPKKLEDRAGKPLMRSHHPAESSLRWIEWNAAAESLRLRHDFRKSMLIRYEDFIERPRTTVEEITVLVGERPQDLGFVDDHTVQLAANHTVSGNPSRFTSGAVKLRADDEWKTRQARADRAMATIFALPYLRRYGYRLRARSNSSS
jgi:hypothetical protein